MRTTLAETTVATWEIRQGDVLEELEKIEAGNVRLVFADPPYNIGVDYGEGKKADQLPGDKYLGWCREWITSCIRTLTPDGSLWVMINDEWADHFGVMLTGVGLHRRSWIKWYETFGTNCTHKFNRTSRHIFHYVRNPKRFVFNREAVSRPSDRQLKYNDRRANPNGKIWDDVWVMPRICGTFKERLPEFPTQLPLEVMRPIVGCASDPEDLVLDPFSGSATTGVVAIESGRRYLGIEKSETFCRLSRQRLERPNSEREARLSQGNGRPCSGQMGLFD
ncbi:MAG: DNA-methyltransferase [Planctomycetota bacterium]|jgi:site-specific DNA-methyltransferase (adenine-specific)